MNSLVWTPLEASDLQATATQCFKRHGHEPDVQDPDVRENCMACALAGYNHLPDSEGSGPNVAGWARMYIEAGVQIPVQWKRAFQRERFSPNRPYAEALTRSLNTFGHPGYARVAN